MKHDHPCRLAMPDLLLNWGPPTLVIGEFVLRMALALRVIMMRRAVGVTLSWLAVIVLLPLIGAVIYLLVGENRLGRRRARRAAELRGPYREQLQSLARRFPVDWSALNPACEPLHRQANNTCGTPALPGNTLELMEDTNRALRRIIRDIDAAEHTVHILFYIWSRGGVADEVVEALVRAAGRGVTCRVLLDAVASRKFLRSHRTRQLREAGVQVVPALPVSLPRMLFARLDLRNHRKIVAIDNKVAYTGSLNIADPRYFKRSAGVGQWVDAAVRVRGLAVEALNLIFLQDWELETGEGLELLGQTDGDPPVQGRSNVQVVPSGPGEEPQAIHDMLLATIYAARHELIMTTPYFVPDDAMHAALCSAARRGVKVSVVVPHKVDFPLVKLASHSHFTDLLRTGVRIHRFRGGLLHAKTITVDGGDISVIGSVNIDMRSFWLNYEVTLFVYDRTFGEFVRRQQADYLGDAVPIDYQAWRKRPFHRRFVENVAQLLGPLL